MNLKCGELHSCLQHPTPIDINSNQLTSGRGLAVTVSSLPRSLLPLRLCLVENNDAASLFARIQIGKRPRCFIDGIRPRDQFIELESSRAIQADQARKIQLRTRRSVVASSQSLLGGRDL